MDISTNTDKICTAYFKVNFNTQQYWEYMQTLKSSLASLEISLNHEKESHVNSYEILIEKEKKLQNEYEKKINSLLTKIERFKQLNHSILQEKKCIEEQVNHERDYVKNLENKLKEATLSYSEALQKAEDRDSSFVCRLSELVRENSELNQTVHKMKFDIEEKNNYLYIIEEQLKRKNECLCQELPAMNKKADEFYTIIRKSQESSQKMITDLCKNPEQNIENINSAFNSFKEENSNLTKELQMLLEKNTALAIEKETLKNENLEKNSRIKELETEISLYASHISFDQPTNLANTSKIFQESSENLEIETSLNINCLISLQNPLEELIKSQEQKLIIQESTISELQEKIKCLEQENSKHLNEICQIKYKTIQDIKLERIKVDEVDLQLQKFCCDNFIENPFVKMLSGVYMYNKKQVSLLLKNNSLICKYGVVTNTIEEFLHVDVKTKKPLHAANATNSEKGKNIGSYLPTTSPISKKKVNHNENDLTIEEKPKTYTKEKLFSPVRKHYKRMH
ncbi:hypothetical protein SteCoe_11315 [Stentor coeruleus]|uniref:Uncharacterized protein n=1 Tax=Stentor coeruleus TaxID=5963 RepID=A0A1R2CDK0_9CILI|nr:hypothetical protein SteCoe_11315 [Stentor coeruleus]